MMIQTALQRPASRSETSCALRCRTNTSRASIAITKARNVAHAHTGTVNGDLPLAGRAGVSAGRFLPWQQPCRAEHGPGAADGALAGDQVVAGCDQLAHGAEVPLALGTRMGHEPEDGSPEHTEGRPGHGDSEERVPRGEQPEQYPEQQAHPQAAQRARAGGAAPGESARHPFDEPQVGSDNVEVLD